jgi:hypothetical protein
MSEEGRVMPSDAFHERALLMVTPEAGKGALGA